MKLKILYAILLISFLTGCTANRGEESEKYKTYIGPDDSFIGAKHIIVADEQGKEVVRLILEEDGSIASVDIDDYQGFNLSIERYEEGLFAYLIEDENIMYRNITHLKPGNDILVYTEESIDLFSKKYQLFDNGQTKIEHWDYINEALISDEEFKKQFEGETPIPNEKYLQ